jgi:hypothetical protein
MTAMTATLVALGEAASDGERSPPLLVQTVTSSAFATKAEALAGKRPKVLVPIPFTGLGLGNGHRCWDHSEQSQGTAQRGQLPSTRDPAAPADAGGQTRSAVGVRTTTTTITSLTLELTSAEPPPPLPTWRTEHMVDAVKVPLPLVRPAVFLRGL